MPVQERPNNNNDDVNGKQDDIFGDICDNKMWEIWYIIVIVIIVGHAYSPSA